MLVSAELNFHGRRFFICSDRTALRSSGGLLRKPLFLPTLWAALLHLRFSYSPPCAGETAWDEAMGRRVDPGEKEAAIAVVASQG